MQLFHAIMLALLSRIRFVMCKDPPSTTAFTSDYTPSSSALGHMAAKRITLIDSVYTAHLCMADFSTWESAYRELFDVYTTYFDCHHHPIGQGPRRYKHSLDNLVDPAAMERAITLVDHALAILPKIYDYAEHYLDHCKTRNNTLASNICKTDSPKSLADLTVEVKAVRGKCSTLSHNHYVHTVLSAMRNLQHARYSLRSAFTAESELLEFPTKPLPNSLEKVQSLLEDMTVAFAHMRVYRDRLQTASQELLSWLPKFSVMGESEWDAARKGAGCVDIRANTLKESLAEREEL